MPARATGTAQQAAEAGNLCGRDQNNQNGEAG